MADQAQQLRHLVRTVRHAAAVSTGPPLMLLYSAGGAELGERLVHLFNEQCAQRGIRTRKASDTSSPNQSIDWQVAPIGHGYQVADHELWQRASALVIATYADDEAVVACYRTLKVASQHTPLPPLEFVVVRHDSSAEGSTALDRLTQTCARFLHIGVSGSTLVDDCDDQLASGISPLVERLAMMAPVASNDANSPIAIQGD